MTTKRACAKICEIYDAQILITLLTRVVTMKIYELYNNLKDS